MATIQTKNPDGTYTYSAAPSTSDGLTPEQIASQRASGVDPYATPAPAQTSVINDFNQKMVGTVPTYTPPPSITSGVMASGSTPTYQQPAPTTPTNIGSIDTKTTATTLGANEQAASDLSTRIQSINDQLAGKSTYQSEQNQVAGVNDIQQAINDNNLAVKQLQKSSTIAKQNAEAGATGSAPRFVVSADQTQIDRQSAVKALTLSSISDALSNNLVSAQHKADQAVADKYGALEAEQKAKMANLDLILKDPKTTLDEKNRASAQQAIVTAQATQTAQDKQNTADVLKTVQDAAQNASNFTPTNGNQSYQAGQLTAFLQSQGKTADDTTLKSLWAQYGNGGTYNNDVSHNSVIYNALNPSAQTGYSTLSQALNAIGNAKTPAEALAIQSATGLVKQTKSPNPASVTPAGNPQTPVVGGNGVLEGGIKVDPTIANDVQAVLEGRNTLYNIRQTMGRTNAAAAYMQKMRDTIANIDPRFDFVASDAGGKFVSTAFYQKATTAITSVQPNIDEAIKLSNQVGRIGVAGVDRLLQAGAIQIGNQKVSNFHEAQKLIADEIGLALGQGTVSDMKLQLGFDVTDPSLKPEVFASNLGIVKDFIANRLSALKNQRYTSDTVHNGINLPTTSGNSYNGITLPF